MSVLSAFSQKFAPVLFNVLPLKVTQNDMFKLRFEKVTKTMPRNLDDAKFLYELVNNNRFFKNFLGSSTREIN
jgi:hypothetical protein